MNQKNERLKYREWLRKKEGCIYRINYTDIYEDRNWKKNLLQMREKIIDQYNDSGTVPEYMITRSYVQHESDRQLVIRNNKRVNAVIDDLFNPRRVNNYHLSKDHFLERHKDELIEENDEWKIRVGGFHVHTLISHINEDTFIKPNRNIRKSLNHIYGREVTPIELVKEKGKNEVVRQLLTHNITRTCGFVGTGKSSINIVGSSDHKEFDGYTGWKGLISYCTKQMYNTDKIIEIYDHQNSSSLLTTK